MHRLKLGIGPVDRRNGVPDRRAGFDCACKEAVVLLASVPHLSGTTKPFSTADVMKAGKTARFFGYVINGLFLPSQVMQAEEDVFLLVHEKTCPHYVRLCPPST